MPKPISELSLEYIPGISGCAVVFLSGLQGTPLELGSIPKQIQKAGHSICHPRIEGYSAQTGVSAYEDWLAQLNHIVDLLYQEHSHVSIIGLSMGATLALAYEAEYQKCRGLSILSPVLAYDGWNVAWYTPLLRIVFKLGIQNWHYRETEPYGLRNLEVRRRVAKQVLDQETTEVGSACLSAKHLYQGLRLIGYAKNYLNQIKADLLVISSIDDDVTSSYSADLIQKEVKSGLCKLIWLGNSYHIITLDNEREIVVNETVEFNQIIFQKSKNHQAYSNEVKDLLIRSRISD